MTRECAGRFPAAPGSSAPRCSGGSRQRRLRLGGTIAVKMLARLLVTAFAVTLTASGQAPAPRPNTYRSAGGATAARARLVSPEIHADRTVTFRIRAPQAAEVALSLG